MKAPTSHLNPGFVVGLLALFVALGGVAMAGGAKPSASPKAPRLTYKFEEDQVGGKSQNGALALCAKREHVVGGGVSGPGAQSDVVVVGSQPVDSGDGGDAPDDGWYGFVENDAAQARSFQVYAICLRGARIVP